MPYRIQMRRTKGWEKPVNAIYVGRPTKWGNPWSFGQSKVDCLWHFDGPGAIGIRPADTQAQARSVAVAMYRRFVGREAPFGVLPAWLDDDLAELRGRDLACWCPLDQPCHADVLLELANRGENFAGSAGVGGGLDDSTSPGPAPRPSTSQGR